jgi:PAS domain S-box-containing protein
VIANNPQIEGKEEDVTGQKEAEETLKEREEQYRAIFEVAIDGMVINDLDGITVEVNQAFCDMHGYTREELIGVDLSTLHPPDSEPVFWEYVQTVKEGRPFMTQGQHIHLRKDGTPFYVEVHGTTFTFDGKPHILGLVRDVTERVRAYELLEQRVEERTRELSTLLAVSGNIVSTLELKPLIMRILDQLKTVADFTGASVSVVEDGRLAFLEFQGPARDILGIEWSVETDRIGPVWDMLRRGEPVIVGDVRGDSPLAIVFREAVGENINTAFAHIRSWMAVPLMLKDQPIGMLTIAHRLPDYYDLGHARLASAIANQAAIAIENARLYEEAQETARITAALAQIASRVAFGGSLKSTLDDICRRIVTATRAVGASVLLFGPGADKVQGAQVAGSFGVPEEYTAAVNKLLAAGVEFTTINALLRRETSTVRNTDPRYQVLLEKDPGFEPVLRYIESGSFGTYVAVPMVYGDDIVGGLLVYYPEERKIDEAEMAAYHAAIADQTAVAVENARLLAQVQEKAALEERQHLARELHDSVSQALFSINLTARGIESSLQKDAADTSVALARIADLRQLTQGALAEMRALIFELRPGALEEEGLLQALRKHAAAVQGRELLQVEVVCPGEEKLPRLRPDAEEALYRIAQEALHNVVKHAKATRVEICIESGDGHFTLSVVDNGTGFDVNRVPAGHLGLGTMGERAASVGGEYSVQSAPGHGTNVTVRIPH